MSYHLGKNILATVTYYDVLEMPLTSFEIWKHLITQSMDQLTCDRPCSIGDVIKFLKAEQLRGKIEEKNGFYFLKGRTILVEKRIRQEKVSVNKLKRMRKLVSLLRFLPYVRMLGATGSLAMKNGTRESDWDMFVVLQSGKIWTGRTLLTGFLHLIGKRRYGNKIQDRACLNYFITDDNLKIGTQDLFSAHEYRFIIPFFEKKIYELFELKNRWIQEYKPNFSLTIVPTLWTFPVKKQQVEIQQFVENILNHFQLENWLASWQKKKIQCNPNTSLEGSFIKADHQSLIFLPRPRGPRVFEKYKNRLSL